MMILYSVTIGDEFHFTYGELDKAIWHIQIALEVGHDCKLISDSDYDRLLPRVGMLEDRDLPWKCEIESVPIIIARTYGVDGNGHLMVGM